jgi:hypothetical protein
MDSSYAYITAASSRILLALSRHVNKETEMKNWMHRVSLTLTTLALTGLALPARAAQSSTPNLIPFKASAVVTSDSMVIPLTPPVAATRVSYSSGQSDLLGPWTGIAHQLTRLKPDGTRLSIDDGIGVWTAASGDSIFVSYVGLFGTSTTPNLLTFQKAIAITGGTGRFAGASGHAVLNGVIDLVQKQTTMTVEGMITPPKP